MFLEEKPGALRFIERPVAGAQKGHMERVLQQQWWVREWGAEFSEELGSIRCEWRDVPLVREHTQPAR